MKSIISRYGEMKSNPTKLVDAEGQEMSLNKVDKALQTVGISIHDAAGQFRDFDDVILELAEKWDTIDANTQRYIATIMAGNRQQSRFLALVSSYDRLKELTATAADSENASQLQYLKTLDSVDAKLQQLQTSMQSLYVDSGLQNVYKGLLDTARNIIQTFTSMPKIFNLPIPAIMKFGTQFINLALLVTKGFALIRAGVTQEQEYLALKLREINGHISAEQKETLAKIQQARREHNSRMLNLYREDAQNKVQTAKQGNAQALKVETQGDSGSGAGGLRGLWNNRGSTTSTKAGMAASAIGMGLSTISTVMGSATQGQRWLKAGTSLTGTAASAVGTALMVPGPAGWILAAAQAIPGLISALDDLIETSQQRIERLKKEAEELHNQAIKKKADYSSLKQQLEEQEKLRANRGNSQEDWDAWIQANNTLAETYPQLIEQIDSEGNALIAVAAAWEKVKEARGEAGDAAKQADVKALEALEAERKQLQEELRGSQGYKSKSSELTLRGNTIRRYDDGTFYDDDIRVAIAASTWGQEFEMQDAELTPSEFLDEYSSIFARINTEELSTLQDQLKNLFTKYWGANFSDVNGSIKTFYNQSLSLLSSGLSATIDQTTLELARVNQKIASKAKSSISTSVYFDLLQDEYASLAEGYQQINNIFTSYIYQAFKASGMTSVEFFSNSEGYQAAFEEIQAAFDDLGENFNTTLFNYITKNFGKFNKTQLEAQLKKLGLDSSNKIYEAIMSMFTQTTQQATMRFNSGLAEIFNRNELKDNSLAKDIHTALESLAILIGPEYYEQALVTFQKIYNNDNLDVAQQNALAQKVLAIYNSINNLALINSAEAQNILDLLNTGNYDLFSLNGIYEFQQALTTAGIDINQALSNSGRSMGQLLGELSKTLIPNLEAEFDTYVKHITDQLQNFEKALQSASKGMDAKAALEMAARIPDLHLTDFQFIDGKYYLRYVDRLRTAYIDQQEQLYTNLMGTVNNVRNVLNMHIFSTGLPSPDLLQGVDDQTYGILNQYYQAWQRISQEDRQNFDEYVATQIEALEADAQKIKTEYIPYLSNAVLIANGQIDDFLDSLNVQTKSWQISLAVRTGDFSRVDAKVRDYAKQLYEYYNNVSESIFTSAIESISSGERQLITVNAANRDILQQLGAKTLAGKMINSQTQDGTTAVLQNQVQNIKALRNEIMLAAERGMLSDSKKRELLTKLHNAQYEDNIYEALDSVIGSYQSFSYQAADTLAKALGETVASLEDAKILSLDDITGEYSIALTQLSKILEDQREEMNPRTYNALITKLRQTQQKASPEAILETIIQNRTKLSAENIESLANLLGWQFEQVENLLTNNGNGTYSMNAALLQATTQGMQDISGALQDIIDEAFKSITTALSAGLGGTLSHADKGIFEADVKSLFNDEIKLDFTTTSEGLKLSLDSAIKLYARMRAINSTAAQLTFKALSDSLQQAGEDCEDMSKTLASIKELEAIPVKNEDVKQRLTLYRQIAQVQMQSPDSYSFMDRSLPTMMQGPVNFWNSAAKAYQAMRGAVKGADAGFMSIEDFRNIITQMGEMAQLSGESLKFMGQEIHDVESARKLIDAGMTAITASHNGTAMIDLSKFMTGLGETFVAGATDMSEGFDDGLKAVAKSQVEMLDGMIRLLETVVAMEKLGSLDKTEDGIFDLTELFRIDEMADQAVAIDKAQTQAAAIIKEAGEESELRTALESVKFGEKSLFKILSDMAGGTALSIKDAKIATQALSSLYHMLQSGEFDLENIITSITDIANQMDFIGTIQLDDKTTIAIGWGVSLTLDEDGGCTVDGKKYPNYEDALAALAANKLLPENFAGDRATTEIDGSTVLRTRAFEFGTEIQAVVDLETGDIVYQVGGQTFESQAEAWHYAYECQKDAAHQQQGLIAPTEEEWLVQYNATLTPEVKIVNQQTFRERTTEAVANLATALANGNGQQIKAAAADVGIEVELNADQTLSAQSTAKIAQLAGIESKTVAMTISASFDGQNSDQLTKLLSDQGIDVKVNLIKGTDEVGLLGTGEQGQTEATPVEIQVKGVITDYDNGQNVNPNDKVSDLNAKITKYTPNIENGGDPNKTVDNLNAIVGSFSPKENISADKLVKDLDAQVGSYSDGKNTDPNKLVDSLQARIKEYTDNEAEGKNDIINAFTDINIDINQNKYNEVLGRIEEILQPEEKVINVTTTSQAVEQRKKLIKARTEMETALQNSGVQNGLLGLTLPGQVYTYLGILNQMVEAGKTLSETDLTNLSNLRTTFPDLQPLSAPNLQYPYDQSGAPTIESIIALSEANQAELTNKLNLLNQSLGPIDSAVIADIQDAVTSLISAMDFSPASDQLEHILELLQQISHQTFDNFYAFNSQLNSVINQVATIWSYIQNFANQTFTVNLVESGSATAQGTMRRLPKRGVDKETQLAQAKGTLMGELGPELFVSGGRYHLVGENGAEMVDLPDDAIVFNHLQTKKLLSSGSTGRGKPVTNERKATAYAAGTSGPAKASAQEALAYLKQLREMWQALAGASAKDLGAMAGRGGGGGDKSKQKAVTADIERWYNLLRQIEKIERQITYQNNLQNVLLSDRKANGEEIYKTYKEEYDLLKQQIAVNEQLAELQKSWYDRKRSELESSAFGRILTYDEHGLQQYKSGKDNGLDILEKLTAKEVNTPTGAATSAHEQLEYLKSIGFDVSSLQYSFEGQKIDTSKSTEEQQVQMMQNFFDSIDGWKSQLDGIYDSYNDQINKSLENQKKQNEILQKITDNQIDVEKQILKGIEDREQAVIDELQKERDALEEASNKYIEGLRDQLNREKQMYDDNKEAEDLNKMRRQLLILQRSGGSASQIKNLQDQIDAKEQEAYFSAQERQIDAIEEASNKQIERLDAQISLMTETLAYQKEHGLLWAEVAEIMKKTPEEIQAFITKYNRDYSGLSDTEFGKKVIELADKIGQWVAYRDDSEKPGDDDKKKTTTTKKKTTGDDGKKGTGGGSGGSGSGSGGGSGGSSGGSKTTKSDKKPAASGPAVLVMYFKDEGNKQIASTRNISVPANTKIDTAKYAISISGYSFLSVSPSEITIAPNTKMAASYRYRKIINKQDKIQKDKASGKVKAFASGGLIDYTGPAVVHGSKSKPESILSADQTAFLRNDFLSGANTMYSAIKDFSELIHNTVNSSTYNSINRDASMNIENISLNMNVGSIANDYDARRAGAAALDEMVRIARKSGTQGVSRR